MKTGGVYRTLCMVVFLCIAIVLMPVETFDGEEPVTDNYVAQYEVTSASVSYDSQLMIYSVILGGIVIIVGGGASLAGAVERKKRDMGQSINA